MCIKTKLKWAVTVLVTLCLMVTHFESIAFAKPAQAAQAPATPAPAAPPADADKPNPPAKKSHRFRWLLIGAGAAAAVAAVFLTPRKAKPDPVVTIGVPTIGTPK